MAKSGNIKEISGMSEITQSDMIKMIVESVKADPQETVVSQFVLEPEYPGEDLKPAADQLVADASNPENWKLHYGPEICGIYSRFKGHTEYCFDCEPMDDQLRASVFVTDGVVKYIEIMGE